MRLRLIMAGAAACAAVLLPAIQSSPLSITTAAVDSAKTSKVLVGTYVEIHADARLNGRAAPEAPPEQWLRTADGKSYQLHFKAQPKLDAQHPVRVTGTVSGTNVAVSSAVQTTSATSTSGTISATSTSGTTSTTTSATTTSGTTLTGTRSVLIMMVNWTRPNATTPSAAQAQIGGATNKWYRDVTYGQMGFSAKATPWMTLPKQDCSLASAGYLNVLAAAEKAAVAHGYDPKAYRHEMVYFPFDANCAYAGLGAVNDRKSWVNGEMDTRVTAHELGHNLGLNHARSATCVNASNLQVMESAKCTTNEYGDLFDAMGVPAAGTPHPSAVQMNHLGWLTGHFATPTTSKSITLSPLENGTGTLAVRIRVGGSEYWLEYRRPVGVDMPLAYFPGSIDGLLIHRIGADGGTDLLDGRSDSTKSFTNAALPVGRTWTSSAGLKVRVTSVSSSQAVVSITFP